MNHFNLFNSIFKINLINFKIYLSLFNLLCLSYNNQRYIDIKKCNFINFDCFILNIIFMWKYWLLDHSIIHFMKIFFIKIFNLTNFNSNQNMQHISTPYIYIKILKITEKARKVADDDFIWFYMVYWMFDVEGGRNGGFFDLNEIQIEIKLYKFKNNIMR